jgi:beta-N-acetylhexoosaminidase
MFRLPLKLVSLICAGASCLSSSAKIEHLLPRPQQLTKQAGAFALQCALRLEDATQTPLLRKVLSASGATFSESAQAVVRVIVDKSLNTFDYPLAGFGNEGYRLDVSPHLITITVAEPIGVVRAAQTLHQLSLGTEGSPQIEALTMTDFPAFKVRGVMHDVGRSFIDTEELKRQIDLLAQFKVNVFHWHLTENQAWRFEVKAFPQLTSAASMTRFPGKFYTQAECRELEEYAYERGVTIIPEIDMPGHSQAFVRAMGHDMQTEQGMQELQTILEEVAKVFVRAPYIHFGADEHTITYPNFLNTIIDKIHSLGKKAVVWNPINGVAIQNHKVDMTQMWSTRGKLVKGIPNIDCRYNYTNHFDVFADLVGIYKSSIYYAERGNAEIAGTISCPWNDRKLPTQDDIVVQNNFYANALASVERGWIGGDKEYVEKGGVMLPSSGEEYEEFADWERRFLYHKATTLQQVSIPYVRQTNVQWAITEAFPNNGNAAQKFPPETEGLKDSYTYQGRIYTTGYATGAGIYLRHTWGEGTIPAYYAQPKENTTAYAWTYVYSPKAQDVGALIEIYNYGRSEKYLAPNNGHWDRMGAKIWLNDREIPAPSWKNAGKTSMTNEDLLEDENFTARPAAPISLKMGWNKVLLKLPFNPNGTRLKKWMFTFVLTDKSGRNALENVIYSPDKIKSIVAGRLAQLAKEVERTLRDKVGNRPGYYPFSLASDVNAMLKLVKAEDFSTLSDEKSQQLFTRLQTAYEALLQSLANSSVNMPLTPSETANVLYEISTPLRDKLLLTLQQVGKPMVSQKKATEKSLWRCLLREDNTYDLRNYSDNSYISPIPSGENLVTTTMRPAKGWQLKSASTSGLFTISSSDGKQFNQGNGGKGFRLLNWGGGTNSTDTGCQFLFTPVRMENGVITGVQKATAALAGTAQWYDLQGRPIVSTSRGILVSEEGQKIVR